MPSDRYFGDDIATFRVDINGTLVTAGKVRDVEITGTADHVELFTASSVTREDVKRREVGADVDMTILEFNEEIAQYWLNGGESTSTTINEDNGVAKFNITVEQKMTDHTGASGDESLKVVANETDFPEMPLINLAEGEYTEKQLSGSAKNVTVTKETVA